MKALLTNQTVINDENKKFSKGIIGSLRRYLSDNYNIYDVWDLFPYSFKNTYRENIKPLFKPYGVRYRRVVPKTYSDARHLFDVLNFELIKGFYEDEYKEGIVDWDASGEDCKAFATWLEGAYLYITKERPTLEKQLEEAYPPYESLDDMFIPHEYNEKGKATSYKMKDDNIPFEVKYKEVHRLEALIEQKDTEILVEAIKKRSFFWT